MLWDVTSLGPHGGLFCWDPTVISGELARQRGKGKNSLERRDGLCKGPEAVESRHILAREGVCCDWSVAHEGRQVWDDGSGRQGRISHPGSQGQSLIYLHVQWEALLQALIRAHVAGSSGRSPWSLDVLTRLNIQDRPLKKKAGCQNAAHRVIPFMKKRANKIV